MFGFEKMKHFPNNVTEIEMSEKIKLISIMNFVLVFKLVNC